LASDPQEKAIILYCNSALVIDGINTLTPAGCFFFHVMASLAQMERELLMERTKAGLAAAKERRRVGSRKRVMTLSKLEAAKKLLRGGMPPKDVSIPTLYRWVSSSK
jgi:DNA invertase Pin-like site-specific DNA recombinase